MRRTKIVKGVPFTTAELKVLAQSPAAVQALIDHYDHEEAKFEAADAADVAKPLEARRHQLEQALRDGLKSQVPSRYPDPGTIETHQQFDAFDMKLAQLAAVDPIQALSNARWMLDQLWWQRQSRESVVRRIDDAVSPRVQGLNAGWFKDTIHELRQSDPQAGMFPARTDEQLAESLAVAIADHFDVKAPESAPIDDSPAMSR